MSTTNVILYNKVMKNDKMMVGGEGNTVGGILRDGKMKMSINTL